MTYNAAKGRYQRPFKDVGVNLDDLRLTIYTNEGGTYNVFVKWPARPESCRHKG